MKLIKKLKTSLSLLRLIRNWPIYLADYLGMIKQDYVVYELRNGVKYTLKSNTYDRNLINEIWIHKLYTKKLNIEEKDTVVDIGGHIGVFSIFASKLANKGKVYSFEPSENFILLSQNIKLNNLTNTVAINKAVSDQTGKKTFFVCSEDSRLNSFYPLKFEGKALTIETISLEDFIKQNNIDKIDFLKIDCEGGEYEILLNCPKEVLNKIKKISMEYHYVNENKNGNKIRDFLEKNGFEVNMETASLIYARNLYFKAL